MDIKSSRGGYPSARCKQERSKSRKRAKVKDKARTEAVMARAPGAIAERVDESSWNETSQPMPPSTRPLPELWISRS